MKFEHIYCKSQQYLSEALLSIWCNGTNPMRPAFSKLLADERLMAEPSFQSTFPWKTTTDPNWRSYLHPDAIANLQIGTKYNPYSHQAESWKQVKLGKSIVVTSGTGSGKTECFMFPVLSDLYEQKKMREEAIRLGRSTVGLPTGVQALFLYPLNALMENQKEDRLEERCNAMNLRFAVYNGSTSESERHDIRIDPPEILLTNPSMLEYILVRKADQRLLNASRGSLRWIVLDEAHSYAGSSAVELRHQILRVLEAFETPLSQVRFICTSATIGGTKGEQALKTFISKLIGKPEADIMVIGGEREVPPLTENDVNSIISREQIGGADAQSLLHLRDELNSQPGLTLSSIWNTIYRRTRPYDETKDTEALTLVDKLTESGPQGSILSARAHMLIRTINGVYACANPQCSHYGDSPMGYITSHGVTVCPHCKTQMLELVQCKDCGEILLLGERHITNGHVRQFNGDIKGEQDFVFDVIDPNAGRNNRGNAPRTWLPFVLQHKTASDIYHNPSNTLSDYSYQPLVDPQTGGLIMNSIAGGQHNTDRWVELKNPRLPDDIHCPACASGKGRIMHFRVKADQMNAILARILLSETGSPQHVWGKYITFTDSRQGTAISAKKLNIEEERNYMRSQLINAILQNNTVSLSALPRILFDHNLFVHISGIDPSNRIEYQNQSTPYKAALVRNLIGRRSIYEANLESLGLLTLKYPALAAIPCPQALRTFMNQCNLTIQDSDWHDFLKLCLDFYVRMGNHIQPLEDNEYRYSREGTIGKPMRESSYTPVYYDRSEICWPQVHVNTNGNLCKVQPRLVLLLCAAMHIDNLNQLNQYRATINNILHQAWTDLTNSGVLTQVAPNGQGYDSLYYDVNQLSDHQGAYYLDLSQYGNQCELQLLDKGWYCPASRRIMDVTFCGYSAAIQGPVDADNFARYLCTTQVKIPKPTRPNMTEEDVNQWIDTDLDVQNLKVLGLWSDMIRNAFTVQPSYIAAEHTAQQERALLHQYVDAFKDDNNYTINVLNCSTTMEMGVDIGSIDIVVMNSVPPAAANYLQRAGRAGRSRQTRALALTMCNATPVAQHAFSNPMWALLDSSEMKEVKESMTIIQRHINSYFLHSYLRSDSTIDFDISLNLESFFGVGTNAGLCAKFVNQLNTWKANPQAPKAAFDKTFTGSSLASFSCIDQTINKISILEQEFKKIANDLSAALIDAETKLNNAINQRKPNAEIEKLQRRYNAIMYQYDTIVKDNALVYLSVNLFLPNANMPTGQIAFDYADLEIQNKRNDKYRELKTIRQQISTLKQRNPNDPRISLLKKRRDENTKELEKLKRETQRTAQTGLNEYAPGQTVVIDERNYMSAGILLFGDYNQQSRRRFIYHCDQCGHTEYHLTTLANALCPECQSPYRSILPMNRYGTIKQGYANAFEPLAFCVDKSRYASRTASTQRTYYRIQAELTGNYWQSHSSDNLLEVATQEDGNIIYYNVGDGNGFAVCKKCGRSAVEDHSGNLPISIVNHEHLQVGGTCSACQNTDNEIERYVVFTACHPTCYSVLRLWTDGQKNAYIKDESTIRSLGVILKRALTQRLGIGDGEVDYGIKKERDAMILFFFDTNKGGSGYSIAMGDDSIRQSVISIAYKMLKNAPCDCDQQPEGACTKCLVDRQSMHYMELLSKKKAMLWLENQLNVPVSIPTNVSVRYHDVKALRQSIKTIARMAAQNKEVTEMNFYVSSSQGVDAADWALIDGEMGTILNIKRAQGHPVNILVEYDPRSQADDIDSVLSLCRVKDMMLNYTVKAVQKLGDLPLLLSYKDLSGVHYVFTDQPGYQPFIKEWGDSCINIFETSIYDTSIIVDSSLPTFADLQQLLSQQGKIILEHDILNRPYFIGSLFNDAIVPAVFGKDAVKYDKLISDIMKDQKVRIEVSDPYVVNGLSTQMLYFLLVELASKYRFIVESLKLKINTADDWGTQPIQPYHYITKYFVDKYERNNYLLHLFSNQHYPITPSIETNNNHHRFIKIISEKGSLEVRPDHGIGGGWTSSIRYRDPVNNRTLIQKDTNAKTQDTIFYVLIDKN